MKKITFEKVKIQNFLSVGNYGIELDFNKGINLINGLNKDNQSKNGVGKSTIADAIFWCLFGNSIREIKKEKLQHNKNDKNCLVCLNFSVQSETETKKYSITRYLNPSKVEIYCEDENITQSTIQKNDEFIKVLIGGNEEVFNNSVIMTANGTLPFMAQKKVDKRKFIEGILQLNIFSDMLLKTRAEYNELKKENDLISNQFISEQKNLELFENQKLNGEKIKNEKIKTFQDKIKDNNKILKDLNKHFDKDYLNLDEKLKGVLDQIKLLKIGADKEKVKKENFYKKKTETGLKLSQKKSEKNQFLKKGNICPTCNREYCKEDLDLNFEKIKIIENEIEKFNNDLKEFDSLENKSNKMLSKILNGIEKLENQKNNFLNKKSEVNLVKEKIKNIQDKNKEYEKYINDILNEKSDYDKNIETTKNKIEEISKNLEKIKKNLQILNSAKFILSEEGIKTFIIKKIIDILNTRLNHYLKLLNAPCSCYFDEMFEETIYNLDNKECSYFNFSGGERKRIDLAVLFMFQDILKIQSGIQFNLNIYDELFDSALDDEGSDKVLEILKNKVEKYEESIYIISHKTSTKSNIDNVIFLEKENGVTKLVS
jgi:DNA repair exonuclease SbcCD ATPase subunit